jgi:hypothetical protein
MGVHIDEAARKASWAVFAVADALEEGGGAARRVSQQGNHAATELIDDTRWASAAAISNRGARAPARFIRRHFDVTKTKIHEIFPKMVCKSEQHFSNRRIVGGESRGFSVRAMIFYLSRTCFGHYVAMC